MRKTTLSLAARASHPPRPTRRLRREREGRRQRRLRRRRRQLQGDGGSGASDPTGGGLGGSGGEAPAVCPDATDVYEVEAAPSNVLFLFDRSGSMHLKIDANTTRWVAAKAGLFALIDELPSDTHAGIQTFPRGDAPVDCCVITADNDIDCGGCASGELPGPANRCDAMLYSDPAVAVGTLDASSAPRSRTPSLPRTRSSTGARRSLRRSPAPSIRRSRPRPTASARWC